MDITTFSIAGGYTLFRHLDTDDPYTWYAAHYRHVVTYNHQPFTRRDREIAKDALPSGTNKGLVLDGLAAGTRLAQGADPNSPAGRWLDAARKNFTALRFAFGTIEPAPGATATPVQVEAQLRGDLKRGFRALTGVGENFPDWALRLLFGYEPDNTTLDLTHEGDQQVLQLFRSIPGLVVA